MFGMSVWRCRRASPGFPVHVHVLPEISVILADPDQVSFSMKE